MIILGSGMAGSLAAVLNPQAEVIEASNGETTHQAVLRFRENNISKLTGIPFKKVKVHKGIWFENQFVKPNPLVCNLYSKKVIGKFLDRSIWNLETVERYIAPGNFHEMLIEMCGNRIIFNNKVTGIDSTVINTEAGLIDRDRRVVVSTLPMKVMENLVDEQKSGERYDYESIMTSRYKIDDCDIHQTVYYPDQHSPIYRATITGSDLIVEAIHEITQSALSDALDAFGLATYDMEPVKENHVQKYGKIAPINEGIRRSNISRWTHKYALYSLGRFATWKNILLDDVLNDIYVIRRLTEADHYEHMKRGF